VSETSIDDDTVTLENANFSEQAGAFMTMMDDMAPQLALDYSVDSLQRLDQFITEYFDARRARTIETSLLIGIGSYFGEVLVRQLHGEWEENGKPLVVNIENLEPINPLRKAQLRFQNGKQDSLAWAYHTLHKKVGEAGFLPTHAQPSVIGRRGGVFGSVGIWFKNLIS
jgi:hypothetical protein